MSGGTRAPVPGWWRAVYRLVTLTWILLLPVSTDAAQGPLSQWGALSTKVGASSAVPPSSIASSFMFAGAVNAP